MNPSDHAHDAVAGRGQSKALTDRSYNLLQRRRAPLQSKMKATLMYPGPELLVYLLRISSKAVWESPIEKNGGVRISPPPEITKWMDSRRRLASLRLDSFLVSFRCEVLC